MSFKYTIKSKEFKKAKRKAKKIGYDIYPSSNKYKKLDVYKNNKYITSIGDNRYSDYNYHCYKLRRINYKKRHNKYRHNKGSRSYLADKIL